MKKNKNHVILFCLLAASLIILSGCEKPECRSSSDCGPRTCQIAKCEDKKCSYATQPNCCGNRINETIENGKPGNKCTCPQDYGKCEGKAKVKAGQRTEDAIYAGYLCNSENKCQVAVKKEDIVPQNILDTINAIYFRATSVLKYNKPFDLSRDIFEFKLTLEDTKDMIPPVRITAVKILYNDGHSRSELLIANREIDIALNSLGESASINVPLNLGYKPDEIEESGSIRYSLDYNYIKKVQSGRDQDEIPIYKEETARETFTSTLKPIFIVRAD